MIIILGPTACGKTKLAVNLAHLIDGEVISADSRQVYRGMDIGTGKDIQEYTINGKEIPYHLIDIVDPGYEYSVFEFQHDFYKVYHKIISSQKIPILCGGTGLYIDSVVKSYPLIKVPINEALRTNLESKEMEELTEMLSSYRMVHNTTDTTDKERLIRAIEIEVYIRENPNQDIKPPIIPFTIFGLNPGREIVRERITNRLIQRLHEGMIAEVEQLVEKGVAHSSLQFYGLEYKYISLYIEGKMDYKTMLEKLNIAIHQFAKRQMTWFRRMEKNGTKIHWLDADAGLEENLERIISFNL